MQVASRRALRYTFNVLPLHRDTFLPFISSFYFIRDRVWACGVGPRGGARAVVLELVNIDRASPDTTPVPWIKR